MTSWGSWIDSSAFKIKCEITPKMPSGLADAYTFQQCACIHLSTIHNMTQCIHLSTMCMHTLVNVAHLANVVHTLLTIVCIAYIFVGVTHT